jgi:hypothetical protein
VQSQRHFETADAAGRLHLDVDGTVLSHQMYVPYVGAAGAKTGRGLRPAVPRTVARCNSWGRLTKVATEESVAIEIGFHQRITSG